MQTDFISFMIASHQRVFLFSLSKSKASLTVFGTWIPNLWVIFWYCLLTAAIICCHFCSTSLVHQAKAGSSWMPRPVAYSATSMGYDSFISLNSSHGLVLPLDTKHPFFSSMFHVFSSSQHKVHIFLLNCIISHLVICYGFHEMKLLALDITLCIHAFCNDICAQFHLSSIGEFHFVDPCIKDRVPVGNTNGISFMVLDS